MDHFFLKIKGILLNKSLKIHMDDRKKKIKREKNLPKSALGKINIKI